MKPIATLAAILAEAEASASRASPDGVIDRRDDIGVSRAADHPKQAGVALGVRR